MRMRSRTFFNNLVNGLAGYGGDLPWNLKGKI